MSEQQLRIARDEQPADAPPNAVYAALQFLRILRRRKQWVFLCCIVSLVAGAAYFLTAERITKRGRRYWSPRPVPDVWSNVHDGGHAAPA